MAYPIHKVRPTEINWVSFAHLHPFRQLVIPPSAIRDVSYDFTVVRGQIIIDVDFSFGTGVFTTSQEPINYQTELRPDDYTLLDWLEIQCPTK